MKSWGLCAARLCAAAWVGAAVLFVVVGVREVTSPDFSSEVKDRLAVLRFPLYYVCGAATIGLAFTGSLIAAGHPELSRRRGLTASVMLALSLVVMAVDFQFVYRPLEVLVTPPGKPRTSEFIALHHWSTRVNTLNVALVTSAAVLLCLPQRPTSPEASGAA